mmetsp:Transcript_58818/g.157217  ORF Transcript_58818/g.157217 Transcript_58818/m.157217 type:complete len:204 (+) Transcript_58818:614-1225(+)
MQPPRGVRSREVLPVVVRHVVTQDAVQAGLAPLPGVDTPHAVHDGRGDLRHHGTKHVARQICMHISGVQAHRSNPLVPMPPGILRRMHHIRQLRLRIRHPPIVRPVAKMQIIQHQLPLPPLRIVVVAARDIHQPGWLGRCQHRGQQLGEQKVAEMAHADLRLEPVLGGPLGAVHHAGVVHEVVQALHRRLDLAGGLAHGGEIV